jgi:hypothetical protein
MNSLSPWHTIAAVCGTSVIKPVGIRQSLLFTPRESLSGENTANAFCLLSRSNHHHFSKTTVHDPINRKPIHIAQ